MFVPKLFGKVVYKYHYLSHITSHTYLSPRKLLCNFDFSLLQMACRAWSEVEEEILLTNLTSLVDQGVWQAENGFHPGYLGVLENQMRVSFPEAGIKENHIEGKIKKWKRDYYDLDAILQIPGFGWNPNENKLVVENDVWNEFVQNWPQLRHFRDREFPNYNRWGHCFVRQEN
ncbi:hypothetical protein RHMOL_Rhmol01G0143000 [Rhododendron molle]|uniref:Uncharacterized protein n=1 Tax=Rhododendron molle TaxID=49168 RepID=A0ACC0Q203_RHOML|nr:hypothetical protein RHMOL_Rhmol01G0143000 [Rhododendron molle]